MVLRYVLGRTDSPAVQAERFKMLAGGAQLIAIGMLAAAIVAPIFNSGLRPSVLAKMGGGASAAIIELIAWHLMGYGVLPVASSKEDDHG